MCGYQAGKLKMRTSEIIRSLQWIARQPNNLEKQIYSIRMQVEALRQRYTTTGLYIPPDIGRFHRAIPYPVSAQPQTISKLWYPPIERTKLSRANFDRQPKFYCSGDPRATLFELQLNPGDTLVLSKWTLTEKTSCYPLGYSPESFKKLHSNRDVPLLIPDGVKHPNQRKLDNKKVEKFFNDIFTEINPLVYKVTAAIAENFFRTPTIDLIAYPAIQVCGNAENFVFMPDMVHRKLLPFSAKWCRVDEVCHEKKTKRICIDSAGLCGYFFR